VALIAVNAGLPRRRRCYIRGRAAAVSGADGTMTDPMLHTSSHPIVRLFHLVAALATLVGNLIPLYGVLYWDWDTFQLLMLYWTETAIIAFWTLRRLARLPVDQLGTMKINGVEKPATTRMMVGFFSVHAGGFILGHLLFLCVLFSGDWFKRPHPSGFLAELVTTHGVWIALALLFVGSWISFLSDIKPNYVVRIERWLQPNKFVAQAEPMKGGVGAIVGMLYLRIFIMQAAIIFGAMLSQKLGSIAPLLIMIGLKTLSDLALGAHAPSGKGLVFSSDNTTFKS
jgi:hypothetical protein